MNRLETTVFEAIKLSADRWGESGIPMTTLQERTGYGRTSLSKAISSLRLSGHIEVTRTKRNFGKLYFNKYRLLK